ncbi:MAG: metallophosphoesterase [Tannerellaceae bacterium]|nr:metallophosphoesterase [Tannerellaceae bacterium]
MKLQYASDLHLEMNSNSRYLKENPLQVVGDILLLAGDISYLGDKNLDRHPFWSWASDNYRETYIVPGNHEYYGGAKLEETLDNFEYYIRPNVSYQNNRSVIIDDIILHFSSLWSIIALKYLGDIQYGMNDFYKIRYKKRKLIAPDYQDLHNVCLNYLHKAINEYKDKQQIVITHNVPTKLCNPEIYKDSPLSSAFVVELEDFIKTYPVDYWIYGHSHYNMPNTVINQTKLLTNQLGYVQSDEHLNFQPDLYFQL